MPVIIDVIKEEKNRLERLKSFREKKAGIPLDKESKVDENLKLINYLLDCYDKYKSK